MPGPRPLIEPMLRDPFISGKALPHAPQCLGGWRPGLPPDLAGARPPAASLSWAAGGRACPARSPDCLPQQPSAGAARAPAATCHEDNPTHKLLLAPGRAAMPRRPARPCSQPLPAARPLPRHKTPRPPPAPHLCMAAAAGNRQRSEQAPLSHPAARRGRSAPSVVGARARARAPLHRMPRARIGAAPAHALNLRSVGGRAPPGPTTQRPGFPCIPSCALPMKPFAVPHTIAHQLKSLNAPNCRGGGAGPPPTVRPAADAARRGSGAPTPTPPPPRVWRSALRAPRPLFSTRPPRDAAADTPPLRLPPRRLPAAGAQMT